MANGFKYDAFISYRHAELDKFVAENLHKKLESYKVSKKVVSNGRARRSRIERVFRDKDELPITNNLEDPIVQALQQSEYLLVICTPRLKESVWCKKEIETFINMHGRDKIFAVLAEGEPHESFPEEILYREGQVQYPDGTIGMGLIPVEPLAADVRGRSKKEILKAMDVEVLRLLAPMLGVDFDDLKQRHRERKFKKIITATLAAAVLCLGIGIASTITALHINKQKQQIEAQSIEIQAQADEIASQSDAISLQNEQLLNNQAKSLADEALALLEDGDRQGAVKKATMALTERDGIEMPYTPEAQYALTKALRVYDSGVSSKPYMQFEMSGMITDYVISDDGKYVAALDTANELCVWNIEDGKKIYAIYTLGAEGGRSSEFCFINNKTILYTTSDEKVNIYDLEKNEMISSQIIEEIVMVKPSFSGNYYVLGDYDCLYIYETQTHTQIASFAPEGNGEFEECYFTEDDIFVYSEVEYDDLGVFEEDAESDEASTADETGAIVHFYDVVNNIHMNDIKTWCDYIYAFSSYGENVYLLGVKYDLNYEDFFGGEDTSCVIKYNYKSQEVVWECVIEDSLLTDMVLPMVDDGHIMASSDSKGYFIHEQNGMVTSSFVMGNSIVGRAVYLDSDDFAVFDDSGEYYYINPMNGEPLPMSDLFEQCKFVVSRFDVVSGGYIICPLEYNKLILYKTVTNERMVRCDEEVLYEVSSNYEENVYDVAKTLDLEKAALVTDMIYNDDKSLMFISYLDGTMDIFDNNSKTLVKTISNIQDGMMRYYGEDSDGNIYISGFLYGYIIDRDYNLIAEVERMRNVNFENNKVIIENASGFYEIPIYTVEELVEIGKQEIED